MIVLPPGYTLSENPADLQLNVIHGFLSQSYWAENIPVGTVARSIENSFCLGVFKNGEQVAFARLITDFATFAYLADVFVLPDHQKLGIAGAMLEYYQNDPRLQGLRRWVLMTLDAHDVYERHGWNRYDDDMKRKTMCRIFPDVYKR